MATTPGTTLRLGGSGGRGSRPGGRPGLYRAPVRMPLSPKSHWEVRVGEARRARGDALWQMLDGRSGAEALLLSPSSLAGCRGDGLATLLTIGPIVAATPSGTSDFVLVEATTSWRWLCSQPKLWEQLLIEATPHPSSTNPHRTGSFK